MFIFHTPSTSTMNMLNYLTGASFLLYNFLILE